MTILTDTNVLVSLMNEEHMLYGSSWIAVNHLLDGGHSLVITSQNLVELWSVCTRPMGLGFLPMLPLSRSTELNCNFFG